MTRRTLLCLLPAICLAGPRVRQYRADATVTFLGIPIFHRTGVGTANVHVEEGSAPNDTRTVALRFSAGSAPGRTNGLNRLGYIQETVIENNARILESAYFGFMTSSKEQNLEQARAAIGKTGKDALPYTAVEGSARGTAAQYQLYEMLLPGSWNFENCDGVIREVRDSLSRRKIQPSKSESVSGLESPRTFLYAIREAMRSASSRIQLPFLYNGKRYRLEVDKAADSKVSQQRGVNVVRLNGSVVNLGSGEKSPFRLWFESGSDLPVRFEYRPRTFLNLVFELSPT